MLALVIVALTGCQPGYPDACANHGGTRVIVKGIYYCNDGTSVGAGWLWLNHKTAAP